MRLARLKKPIRQFLIILIPSVAGLLGCVNIQKIPLNQTHNFDSTVSPTMNVRSKLTAAYLPSATYRPLLTATLTPIPTLKPAEANDALRQLLKYQEPCQSPCFWGITPGQTTLGEAQNIFNRLGLRLHHTFQKEGKDFYATDFGLDSGLGVSIVSRVQDGLVDSINTNIGLTNDTEFSDHREWVAFSPETILAQYGMPTRIEFLVGLPPCGSSPCQISYSMIMYFDPSNLVVEYDSRFIEDEKIIKICPLIDKFDGVGVWLGNDAENVPTKQGVSLEDSTSLTIEQFYKLILHEPQTACFDLSRDEIMPLSAGS